MEPEILPEHTRLSASGAERWMNCPGSQVLAETLGLTGEESSYAAEGTAAHALAEGCLKSGTEAWEYLDNWVDDYHRVTEDMSNAVQVYLDYCRALMRKYPDAEVLIECRVDNKALHPDFGGTPDFTLIAERFIEIVDYKHGIGIAKDAVENPQPRYYGLGSFLKLSASRQKEIRAIKNTIIQPRAFHPEGIVRSELLSPFVLKRWADEELFPAMKAVDEPNAPLKAGEHCRFCPTKIGCPVMKAMAQAAAEAKAEDAALFTDDELGLEYEKLAPVRMYLKAVQDEAYARAMKGKQIPGGKMVRGRVSRTLIGGAADKALEKWGDEAITEPKPKSPAQLEKLRGGKVWVAANAFKLDGKMIFVPLDHKAKEVKVDPIGEKFAGIKRG